MIATLLTTVLLGVTLADEPKKNDEIERVVEGKSGPPKVSRADVYATPLPSPPRSGLGEHRVTDIEDLKSREFAIVVYRGADELSMEPRFVHLIREGLEHLYLRDYKESRNAFARVEKEFPNTGLSAVNEVLIWQAMMLENFDFRFQAQYWTASKRARIELGAAREIPGNEGWEAFMMAGIAGIESIHTMRQNQYLKALQLAFEAVDHVAAVREAAPEFTDLMLADGMYNYWRTVVTMNSKLLPDFGDHRVEGIRQILAVEQSGIFLSAPATLSLVFSWIEEGDLRSAIGSCLRNKRAYPDNVVNNLVSASTYVYMRRYDLAQERLDAIAAVDPGNRRMHYWRGLAHLRSKEVEAAAASFRTYLGFDYLEDYHRSHTHYRLAQALYKLEDYGGAEENYKAAVKIDGHKRARDALDRMKQAKREGKIRY